MMELLGFFAPSLEASKIFATAADHRGHRRCGMVPNGVRRAQGSRRRGMGHPGFAPKAGVESELLVQPPDL